VGVRAGADGQLVRNAWRIGAPRGVPPTLIDRTFAEARRFHEQPFDDKMALRMNEDNNGYMTMGRYAVWTSDEMADGIRARRANQADRHVR
jgi:isopenicillin N synthase-like dioxygenase